MLPSAATGQAGPAGRAQHFSRMSCSGLPQHLVDAVAEPAGATLVRCLGETGPDDQHVVSSRRQRLESRAPELAQATLDPVSSDGTRDGFLRHRQPEPRLLAAVLACEPVKRQEPRRNGATVPVDGIEVSRARETVTAVHGAVYAERRLRPRARRRFTI